ncbi:MAG: exosortase-associated EpsI family protein [Phycisphaerales bacterium JB060]
MVAAPLTAFVLAAMAMYSLAATRPSSSEAYLARVRHAIEGLPTRIEGYFSVDREPLPSSVELLRPNKLLQRYYENPRNGSNFSILVVHCADVRDMMGHYPPVCYPSNGWDVHSVTSGTIDRSVGGPIPITRYEVSRGDGVVEYARVIANTFIVPRADSPLGRDDSALDNVTRTRWSSGLGAAQVQIITDRGMDDQTRTQIERAVADELQGLIDAVAWLPEVEGEGA